jgi:uncharacterized protein (TIRG00374 family)
MPESSTKFRFPWHAVLIAALTIGLLWGFIRGANLKEVWFHIKSADPVWIAAAVVMTMFGFFVRAWRWQALLWPLGAVRFRNSFRTTVMGFTATNLLPGRLGEVLRPYLLARAESLPFSSALATIVIERVFLDLASILLLFGVFLMMTTVVVDDSLKVIGALGGLYSVGALAVLILCAGHPERLGRWAGRLAALLPGRAAEAVTGFVRTLAEGLAVMRRPAPFIASFALSVLLWLSISFGIWFTAKAFSLTITPVDSFLIAGYLAVGVSIPTPGGLGGFDWAFKKAATDVFNVDQNQAAAAAMVLHAVAFIPVTLPGLFFMWQDKLTVRSMKRVKASVKAHQGDEQ